MPACSRTTFVLALALSLLATSTMASAVAAQPQVELIAIDKKDAAVTLAKDIMFAIPEELEILSGSALNAKVDFHFRALNPKSPKHHCIYEGKPLGLWNKLAAGVTGKKPKENILALQKCSHNLAGGSRVSAGEFRLKLHGGLPPLKVRLLLEDSHLPTPTATATATPIAATEFLRHCENVDGSNSQAIEMTLERIRYISQETTCEKIANALRSSSALVLDRNFPKRVFHEQGRFWHYEHGSIATPLTIDLNVISEFENIEEISCANCGISDISALSSLKNIQILFLPGNRISDITPLKNLIRLRILNLSDNNITNLSPLFLLPSIQMLQADGNPTKEKCPENTAFRCHI